MEEVCGKRGHRLTAGHRSNSLVEVSFFSSCSRRLSTFHKIGRIRDCVNFNVLEDIWFGYARLLGGRCFFSKFGK